MSFEELLPLIMEAAAYLDSHTVTSKEKLDQVLAEIAAERLPKEKLALWNGPSMYGNPDRQTVGGAVVSFLLRPCSFAGLVVFGRREGSSPTFTSWEKLDRPGNVRQDGRREGAGKKVSALLWPSHCQRVFWLAWLLSQAGKTALEWCFRGNGAGISGRIARLYADRRHQAACGF